MGNKFVNKKLLEIAKTAPDSMLLRGMSSFDIAELLGCSGAFIKEYDKNQIIFNQEDKPRYLHILLEGSVIVCKDSVSGRRIVITNIVESWDIFGEVYLFLPKNEYEYYALSTANTKILCIPKEFFTKTCSTECKNHSKLISNMLGMLSQKAYYLSHKLQVLSSGTLRQKISKYLLDNCDENGAVKMSMNREAFSDYLNVARPSLSRELIKMQSDGLISIEGKFIKIINSKELEDEL